ncbi:MAG: hypothetical protein PHV28_12410, partial [Kiritimatiellae bacterium]|nr:hypothetical protein [Kiritimatiellia bacterium]
MFFSVTCSGAGAPLATVALKSPTTGGNWSDTNLWNVAREPRTGDAVTIAPTGPINITLDKDVSVDFFTLDFKTAALGASLHFFGNGHTLLLPTSPTGAYSATEPFHFKPLSEHIFSLESYAMGAATRTNAPVIRMTNPQFLLSLNASNKTTLTFEKGIYNSYDPEGAPVWSRTLVIGGNGSAPAEIAFLEGTSLKALSLMCKMNYHGDRLSFLGGTHQIFGALTFCDIGTRKGRSIYLDVAGGADLAVNSLEFGTIRAYPVGGGDGKPMNLWLRISDGGILRSTASDVAFREGFLFLNMTNGTLRSAANVSFAAEPFTTQKVVAVSSVIDISNKGIFSRETTAESVALDVEATNTSFRFSSATVNKNADLRLLDCVWNSKGGSTSVGYGGSLTFTRGMLTNTLLYVGNPYSGTLVFSGGDHQFAQLLIGNSSNSYGTVRMTGGTFDCRSGDSTVGFAGNGRMFVEDGHLNVKNLFIGDKTYEAPDSPTSMVHQTGGWVTLSSAAGNGRVRMSGSTNHKTALILDGGVFEASGIYGAGGALCKGGSGHVLFSADGGTLRINSAVIPDASASCAFQYLDRAEFGAKGLTLDSNGYDLGAVQSFTNKEGQEGLLVKAGTGTFTLSAPSYDVARTRVEGGTLLVTNETVLLATALAITNGGAFSLIGTATNVTLPSLDVYGGTLAFDAGDVIEVTGAAEFRHLSVKLGALPPKDTAQPLLVCAGELSAESQAAISYAYCASGLDGGTHATFASAYDETAGKTVVSVTVKDDVPPLGPDATTTWTGVGFDGVQFHDDDAVPNMNDLTPAQVIEEASKVKKVLDDHGL